MVQETPLEEDYTTLCQRVDGQFARGEKCALRGDVALFFSLFDLEAKTLMADGKEMLAADLIVENPHWDDWDVIAYGAKHYKIYLTQRAVKTARGQVEERPEDVEDAPPLYRFTDASVTVKRPGFTSYQKRCLAKRILAERPDWDYWAMAGEACSKYRVLLTTYHYQAARQELGI